MDAYKLDEDGKILLNRKAILHRDRGHWAIRRTQDIIISLLAILFLWPLGVVISILILIDDHHSGPIFTQERCGRDGKVFKLYKFRTMYPNAEDDLEGLLDQNMMEGPVFKMKDDPRVTRIGKFLRKTSLDELPQFLNVLRGEMSIIGPRPALPAEVAQYTDYQKQRLYITQGITCYWQIQPKRNEMSFDEWVALDLKYIVERNQWVDLKILLGTVLAVLRGEGI